MNRTAESSANRGLKLMSHSNVELSKLIAGPNGRQIAEDIKAYFRRSNIPEGRILTFIMSLTR